MAKIIVRMMYESDLNIVSELAMLANPHATKEKYRNHILGELRANPHLSLVAVDEENVVGYAQADTHNDMAMLEDIVVAREYQRKGIGKQLLNSMLEALKQKEIKIVFAEVHYECASAIPFYYKYNFRISGFGQDYFGMGHDAIILNLVLQ